MDFSFLFLVYRAAIKDIEVIKSEGAALGMGPARMFDKILEEKETKIHPGDVLVQYSDGITEAMNNEKEEYSQERLEEVVKISGHDGAAGIAEALQEDLKKFVGDADQSDDITFVAVGRKQGVSPPQ